ncbi:MAG TPA: Lrp/AsnC family transcriptional regulator [Dehalococcoidia bacterium]
MIDDIDAKILSILQENARTSNAEIARRLEMAPSAVFERIRKLEARGVIQGYEARLDPKALGSGLLAFIFVRLQDFGDVSVGRRLAEMPEVQEVHSIAGEDCYLVKVRTRDPESLGRLLQEWFTTIGPITSTRTTIVLGTVKESSRLSLPVDRSGAGDA